MSADDINKIVLAGVALVALFVGPWIQLRIAKKQLQMQADLAKQQIEAQLRIATRQIADNISSKRQNWIDELRTESAEFLTVVGRIQELKRLRVQHLTAKPDAREDYMDRLAAQMRARELGTRIRLRLNPKEVDHNHLYRLIAEIASKQYDLNREYSAAEDAEAAKIFNDAVNAVIAHLQTILKHEWERVKAGDI